MPSKAMANVDFITGKVYLGGESNPYLMFRKHLFYPLNYHEKMF